MNAYVLEWDGRPAGIVFAATDDQAERLVYEHHIESGAYLRGTVRHWTWRLVE